MKRIVRKLKWLLPAGAAAIALVWWLSAHSLPPEARREFEWFNTLGFPDVKDRPLVRINAGTFGSGGHKETFYTYGFSVATNAVKVDLFTLGFTQRSYTNAPTPGNEMPVEYLDLKQQARALARELRRSPGEDFFPFKLNSRILSQNEVFILAWACWRNGLDPEAGLLFATAKNLPEWRAADKTKLSAPKRIEAFAIRTWNSIQEKFSRNTGGSALHNIVEQRAAQAAMWAAVGHCTDSTISRDQLAQEFEIYAAHYPGSSDYSNAVNFAKILRRMAPADAAHNAAGAKDLDQLPEQERVRELIFRLRDQTGESDNFGRGIANIFGDGWHWPGTIVNTNTPAHFLARIGYPAVPQLIEAVDSDDLSRAVAFTGRFGGQYEMLTVGDCALQVLQHIARQSFDNPPPIPATSTNFTSTNRVMSPNRLKVETWWANLKAEGEEQLLIDGVAAGNSDSATQAELLVEKYPADAIDAIRRGLRASPEEWNAGQLLEVVAGITNETSLGLLREETTNAPILNLRVAAAAALWHHGHHDEAVAAMIAEWEHFSPAPGDPPDGSSEMIDFLAHCNSSDAIAAIGKNFQTRPPDVRALIVRLAGDKDSEVLGVSAMTNNAEIATPIEDVLAAALNDREEAALNYSENDTSFSNPRICDVAAWRLSQRWPDRYSFDPMASFRKRERQRVECLNVWRKAHALAALPIPTPAVKVARTEAAKVMNIDWDETGAKPSDALTARVAKMKDKRLSADRIVELLTNFAQNPEAKAAGIEIEAYKDADLTGVELKFKLEPAASSPITRWDQTQEVRVGHDSIWSQAGGGDQRSYYATFGYWSDLQEAIDKALAAPPETPFQISVRLVGQ